MLSAALAQNEVRPAVFDFANLLGAYLAGDRAAALQDAPLIENDPSPFGLIARALAGNMEGEHDKARRAVDRLIALNPAWATDPRRLLAKFFPVAEVRDRLLHDLEAAGLHASSSPSP